VNLRNLSNLHFELIKSFKIKSPQIEFPPLHRELFNVDYYVYCHQQQQMQQLAQQQQQQQPIYHHQQQQQQQQLHLPHQAHYHINNGTTTPLQAHQARFGVHNLKHEATANPSPSPPNASATTLTTNNSVNGVILTTSTVPTPPITTTTTTTTSIPSSPTNQITLPLQTTNISNGKDIILFYSCK
jgi:hypothetical protein